MTEPERDLAADFAQCKDEILRALEYTGGTHTLDDVWEAVVAGKLQLWVAPHSVMVTEIEQYPRCRTLHFFLAAGKLEELEAMYPVVMEWGKKEMGCDRASLAGRPGWARSFLTKKNGWLSSHLVLTKEMP